MDTSAAIVIFSVLGSIIIGVTVILIKSIASPKRIDGIKKLIKDGKYQQAEKLAKQIIAKDPRDYIAHYLLGEAYYLDEKYDLAFIEYKLVNQNALFDGQIPEVAFRKHMAELYTRFKQPQEALKEHLLLTKMDPQNADNYYETGKIYEDMNQHGNAMAFYQKAATANKKHSKAHAAMGYLLYRAKQFENAKREIDLAIRINPSQFSNYYYLGRILRESKDYSGALKALEKAQRDPEFRQRALIERGSCYMAVDHIDNAMAEFEHAIKVATSDSNQETLYARYFLAACYEKSRNIDKAIAQWEKIYAKNRSFRDVGAKLQEYKDLQSNDSMKEYLTSSPADFEVICQKAVRALGYEAKKTENKQFGCIVYAAEQKGDNWMSVRQQTALIEFHRVTDPLEDTVVRRVHDNLKNNNCNKGIICTSSSFTPTAIKFAEIRPVVLLEKEKLEAILAKAGV